MGTHPIFESDFDCLTDRYKMSGWDAYIDSIQANCGGSEIVDVVGLFALDGSLIAQAGYDNFDDIPQETAPLSAAFDKSDFSGFYQTGVKVNGDKYTMLKYDDLDKPTQLMARKSGNGFIITHFCNTMIAIVHGVEGSCMPEVNNQLHRITNYLVSLNY